MKNKPSHTPGPWVWDEMDGRIYITPEGRPCHYVADINSRETDPEGDYPTRSRREANAAIIAAAPDMLTALKAALVTLSDDELYSQCKETYKTVELAIAKAEGRS
jgi:hypothetical protein